MAAASYERRRGELEEYFDRTAAKAWERLTSDAPVGRIRATVRAGRQRMQQTLLGYLPKDLSGQRVLDAGCGTGTLSLALARRGAHVIAVDISPTLVDLAKKRTECEIGSGSVEFHVADMLEPRLGAFDWVVALDSLIHYAPAQLHALIGHLCSRTRQGVAVTFAPKTPLLSAMHVVGKLFPRGNRSPDIRPISQRALEKHVEESLDGWAVGRSELISSGFYTSRALELVRQ